jgi:hypothetical protein
MARIRGICSTQARPNAKLQCRDVSRRRDCFCALGVVLNGPFHLGGRKSRVCSQQKTVNEVDRRVYTRGEEEKRREKRK